MYVNVARVEAHGIKAQFPGMSVRRSSTLEVNVNLFILCESVRNTQKRISLSFERVSTHRTTAKASCFREKL